MNDFDPPSDPAFSSGSMPSHTGRVTPFVSTACPKKRSSESLPPSADIKRHGVVAVVPRSSEKDVKNPSERDYLVIRRSSEVIAPGKLCFPGGGIEAGETAEEAVRREFREEVGTEIILIRPIWENVTPWNVHLRWFLARLAEEKACFLPQKEEVAECFWMNLKSLLLDPDTLTSNVPFLEDALAGRIDLMF